MQCNIKQINLSNILSSYNNIQSHQELHAYLIKHDSQKIKTKQNTHELKKQKQTKQPQINNTNQKIKIKRILGIKQVKTITEKK